MNRTTSKGASIASKGSSAASKDMSASRSTSGAKSKSTKPKPRESVFSRISTSDTFATRGARTRGADRRETAVATSTARARRSTTSKSTPTRTYTKPMKLPDTQNSRVGSITLQRKRSGSSLSTKSKPGNRTSSQASSRRTSKRTSKVSPVEPPPVVVASRPKVPVNPRESIKKTFQGRCESTVLASSLLGIKITESLGEIDDLSSQNNNDLDPVFKSQFAPEDMRCLALVAHNHMKAPMRKFVVANKNLIKKFVLTGTNTTITMLKEVFGDDPSVRYGPVCTSGPLGGDAELVAVMCTENLGACVFFQDPMSAHPHVADIECLTRQANVHNIVMMPNPASAYAVMTTLRLALKEGRAELIPSFFQTLVSPSVDEYKMEQAKVLELHTEDTEDHS